MWSGSITARLGPDEHFCYGCVSNIEQKAITLAASVRMQHHGVIMAIWEETVVIVSLPLGIPILFPSNVLRAMPNTQLTSVGLIIAEGLGYTKQKMVLHYWKRNANAMAKSWRKRLTHG